jgi:hypothetical protein
MNISLIKLLWLSIIFSIGIISYIFLYEYRKDEEIKINEIDNRKYLILPIDGGFSNQLISLSIGAVIARKLNRVLVIPPLTSSHIDRSYYKKLEKLSSGHITINANISGLYEVYGNSLLSGILEVNDGTKYVTLDKYTKNNIETWKCWHWNSDENNHLEYLLEKHKTELSSKTLCIGNAFTINRNFSAIASNWMDYSVEVKTIGNKWIESVNMTNFIAIHFRGTDFSDYLGENFVSFEKIVPIVKNIASKYFIKDIMIITDEKNETIINSIHNLGWKRFNYTIEKDNEQQLELYTLVVEQYIASLSSVFIGCSKSTFSRTITKFKKCNYNNKTCYDYISMI